MAHDETLVRLTNNDISIVLIVEHVHANHTLKTLPNSLF